MSTTTTEQTAKVITGVVRLSFLHIWEPSKGKNDKPGKYEASLIIPKSDKITIKKIEAAVEAAKEAGKKDWGGKIPSKLKLPLRDGSDREDDPAYENSFFVSAKSTSKPGVVDLARKPITNHDEVYSGCYAVASITFYPYEFEGSKGIACALNHIMKVKDGEPLGGGRTNPEDDFAEVEIMETDDLM